MQLYAAGTGNRIAGKPRSHRQNALHVAAIHERDIHVIEPELVAADASAQTPLYGQIGIELLADLEKGHTGHHGGEPLLLVVNLTGTGANIKPAAVVVSRAVVAVSIGRHAGGGKNPGENQSRQCNGRAHRHLREVARYTLDLASDLRMVQSVP